MLTIFTIANSNISNCIKTCFKVECEDSNRFMTNINSIVTVIVNRIIFYVLLSIAPQESLIIVSSLVYICSISNDILKSIIMINGNNINALM